MGHIKPGPRARYDWEAIERDFRTGRYSLQQLSDKHGPHRGVISRKARDEGWEKDLTDAVAERTRAKLARRESAQSDIEAVEAAASENAEVVRSHRAMMLRWRGINERFIETLSAQLATGKRAVLDRHGNAVEVDVDLEYTGRCMTYGTQAMERVIKLERQSYGLDVDGGEDGLKSFADLMAEVAPDASTET